MPFWASATTVSTYFWSGMSMVSAQNDQTDCFYSPTRLESWRPALAALPPAPGNVFGEHRAVRKQCCPPDRLWERPQNSHHPPGSEGLSLARTCGGCLGEKPGLSCSYVDAGLRERHPPAGVIGCPSPPAGLRSSCPHSGPKRDQRQKGFPVIFDCVGQSRASGGGFDVVSRKKSS